MAHSWFSAVHNLNLNWKYSLCSKLWSYTSRSTSIQAFSPARVLDTQNPVSLNGPFFITVVYQNQEIDIVPSTNFIRTSPIHTYPVVSVGACVCVCVCIVLCFFFFLMAALSLFRCSQAFPSCGESGLLFIAVGGVFIVVASLGVDHGQQRLGLK